MSHLRFRQIHLDFHTSEHIPGVGSKFDPKEFVEILKSAHINSVTCFSKCHHGWSYHSTSVGKKHPHLKCELLPLQIEACHSAGIKAPVYISAGLDMLASREHMNWRVMLAGMKLHEFEAGFRLMCMNTDYLDYLLAQTEEVLRQYDVDGIFFDIIAQPECLCEKCISDMLHKGLDPENKQDRITFQRQVLLNYYQRTTHLVHQIRPGLPVFHNSGHINRNAQDLRQFQTHFELESLPTAQWGYDHFPLSVRFVQKLGKEYLGMTGKFHTHWGEFGGYKLPAALKYETAFMVANGAKCSVGDQLHPNGKIDKDTYRIIGHAYKYIESVEPWCEDVQPIADIGVVDTLPNVQLGLSDDTSMEGAVKMLLEKHYLFDVLETESDFTPYKVLILPDTMTLSEPLAKKLDDYLQAGGKILLSGCSGMDSQQKRFLINWDVEVIGPSEFCPDYLIADRLGGGSIPSSPMVMYERCWRVKPNEGQWLCRIANPYFNRSWKHFCSHMHTPYSDLPVDYPAAVLRQNILWFAHPVFRAYKQVGQAFLRDVVSNGIKLLLDKPIVHVELPSAGRVTLMHQEKQKRYILHLLYACPTLRGFEPTRRYPISVIEDIVPLYDVRCNIRLPVAVKRVYQAPQMKELFFEIKQDVLTVNVPEVNCHQMVVFEY